MPAQRLVLSPRDHGSFSTPCHSDTALAARARSLLLPKLPVPGGVRRQRSSVSLECAVSAPELHTQQQHQTHTARSHTPPSGRVDEPAPASPHHHPQHRGTRPHTPQRSIDYEPSHPPLALGEMGFRADFDMQYSLLEVLGKGNFGVVWLAASRLDPSHQVAVKVLPKVREDKSKEENLACIKREVALWGSLSGDSRYVAQLLGLYEDGGSVYLVQQRCYGDLTSAMQHGPLSEACAAAIMWCVLSAIRDCHDHHLAMVDVKPQNFLLTSPPAHHPAQQQQQQLQQRVASAAAPAEAKAAGASRAGAGVGAGQGQALAQCACPVPLLSSQDFQASHGAPSGPCVVACDFGCSLSYSELMRGGRHGGSPIFFAPEQFGSSYGLGVDVWAAGVMLYLLLSGRYPFWDCKREDIKPGMKPYEVMLAVCSAPIQFLSPEWRGVSRDARDLVTCMLDRNPATRLTAEQALEHPWFARWMAQPAHGAHGAHADKTSAPAAHSHKHAAAPSPPAAPATWAPAAASAPKRCVAGSGLDSVGCAGASAGQGGGSNIVPAPATAAVPVALPADVLSCSSLDGGCPADVLYHVSASTITSHGNGNGNSNGNGKGPATAAAPHACEAAAAAAASQQPPPLQQQQQQQPQASSRPAPEPHMQQVLSQLRSPAEGGGGGGGGGVSSGSAGSEDEQHRHHDP